MRTPEENSKIKEKLFRSEVKMGRKEERMKKKLEKNPVQECNKIQKQFYPQLFQKFAETWDPRHPSYIIYDNKVMLGTMYYKGIAGINSMQDMTDKFNDEKVAGNLTTFMNADQLEYLPHHVTENEYLERLDPQELQDIQQDIVYQMIRRKSFRDARFRKSWLIIIDGIQLYSGGRRLNEQCLERHYKKGTDQETVNYHRDVLEAKIYFGEKLIISIGSEFIENNSEDAQRQRHMNAEEIKQDCETKAFQRLVKKLKKKFPRLPITLLADSLYASETVMEICEAYEWNYIIRFKDGSIPSIAKEYEAITEKEAAGHAGYINEIDYNGRKINVLRYWEEQVKEGGIERTDFQWLTNIKITQKNAEKIARAGRKRWKIENEGFNRQKNWQGDITHACSWNDVAQKNHYLMTQIADVMKQLYEVYYLKKNEIKKKQKNISSDLLESFEQHLTSEDIFTERDTHGVSTN